MSKNQNPFVIASEIAKPFGLKPHFYNDSDKCKAYLSKFLHTHTMVEKLYTYHAPLDLKPMPTDERKAIKEKYGVNMDFLRYGVRRLDSVEFLLRPHMANVKSCHAIYPGNNAPGGNANYLANPSWACYALYCGETTETRLEDTHYIGINSLPCNMPVATVNALIGTDDFGHKAIMFTRTYGDSSYSWDRLVTHFLNQGFKVYIHNSYRLNCQATKADNVRQIYGIPAPVLVNNCESDSRIILPYRYGDIDYSLRTSDSSKLLERHTAYALVRRDDYTEATRMFQVKSQLELTHNWDYFVKSYTPDELNRYGYRKFALPAGNIYVTKPQDALPCLDWLTELYDVARETGTETMLEDEQQETCAYCDDYCDADDTTYVERFGSICSGCLDSHFVYMESAEEYVESSRVSWSDLHNDYVLDRNAESYICDVRSNGDIVTDIYDDTRDTSDDLVELSVSYRGYDMACIELTTCIPVWTNAFGVEDETVIINSVPDRYMLEGEDVYVYPDNVNAFLAKYPQDLPDVPDTETPSLFFESEILQLQGRDAEANLLAVCI